MTHTKYNILHGEYVYVKYLRPTEPQGREDPFWKTTSRPSATVFGSLYLYEGIRGRWEMGDGDGGGGILEGGKAQHDAPINMPSCFLF